VLSRPSGGLRRCTCIAHSTVTTRAAGGGAPQNGASWLAIDIISGDHMNAS